MAFLQCAHAVRVKKSSRVSQVASPRSEPRKSAPPAADAAFPLIPVCLSDMQCQPACLQTAKPRGKEGGCNLQIFDLLP